MYIVFLFFLYEGPCNVDVANKPLLLLLVVVVVVVVVLVLVFDKFWLVSASR